MDKIKEILTVNLKKARESRGMTQAQAAEAIGISLSGYAQIEYGKTWPSSETLGSIEKAFNVTVGSLFTSERDSKDNQSSDLVTIFSALPSLNERELKGILLLIENSAGSKKISKQSDAV